MTGLPELLRQIPALDGMRASLIVASTLLGFVAMFVLGPPERAHVLSVLAAFLAGCCAIAALYAKP